MAINTDKLDKCIRDLRKIMEAERALQSLEIIRNTQTNITKFIEYALSVGLISTLEEVFYLVQQIPEISDTLAQCIRKSEERAKLVDVKPKTNTVTEYVYVDSSPRGSARDAGPNAPYQYNGKGYNSIKEIPGYGTEWNDRCVPDGVNRNSSNGRC